jgi:hypothetical protein
MATRRPTDYTPEALAEQARQADIPLTVDEEFDEVEDILRETTGGSFAPYHLGDEEPGNMWFGYPPLEGFPSETGA